MTAISSNSAALTILTQASPALDNSKSAADNILSIVSGSSTSGSDKAEEARLAKLAAQKAKIAALDQPREAGGNVTSEISSTWTRAMSQVVQGTALAYASVETAGVAGTASAAEVNPWDAAVSDATESATIAVALAIAINAKFHLEPKADLGSQLSGIEAQRQQKIASGEAEEAANTWAQQRIRIATAQDTATEMLNKSRTGRAEGAEMNLQEILARFGVSDAVSVDESGRATVKAFDIAGPGGQKLLSIGEDGSMTTFNSDGSVRSQLSRKEVSLAATIGGNEHVRWLERRGADLNEIQLY